MEKHKNLFDFVELCKEGSFCVVKIQPKKEIQKNPEKKQSSPKNVVSKTSKKENSKNRTSLKNQAFSKIQYSSSSSSEHSEEEA